MPWTGTCCDSIRARAGIGSAGEDGPPAGVYLAGHPLPVLPDLHEGPSVRPPGEPVHVQVALAEAPGPKGIEAQEEAEEEAIGAAMAHHEDRRVVEAGRQGRQERAQTGQLTRLHAFL